jgi:hypothetical protein
MVGDATGGGWDEMVELTEIGEPPQNIAGWVPHHFQFKVNGKQRLKAIVDVDGVKMIELPKRSKPKRARS